MDQQQRELRRLAVQGDHDAYIALCHLQDRTGRPSVATRFFDNHSHGLQKTPYDAITIEAPEEQAIEIFKARLGFSPFDGWCECCGVAFKIDTHPDLWQATACDRDCAFDRETDQWVERERKRPLDGYQTLEQHLENRRYLVITKYDFTPEEAMIALGARSNPLPLGTPRRREAKKCMVCGATTREGKLYCPEHIEQSQYVIDLHRRIQRKEDELARIKKIGAVAIRPDSENVLDVISQLKEHGPQTVARLSHLVDLDADLTQIFAEYLIRQGYAVWEVLGSKGAQHVALLPGRTYLPKVKVDRTLTSKDIAREFGVSLGAISAWTKKGAPHAKVKGKLRFNLDEIRAWREEHRSRAKAGFKKARAKFKGVMNVKPFDEEFWPALKKDYLGGMTVNEIIKKYPVGWKRLNRYLQTKKVSRPRIVRLKGFDEPFWEELEARYVAGEPIQDLTRDYHVDKPRIHRYMEQKGITRELRTKRTTFDEAFWEDLKQDYLAGMSLPKLKAKYHTSGDVVERYLEHAGLPSFKERQEKARGFSDPMWEVARQDYLDGMAINKMVEKHKVGKRRLLRFIESEGLTRAPAVRKPKAFVEPFWESVAQDYAAGMGAGTVMKKYNVGRARLYRFLDQRGLRGNAKLARYNPRRNRRRRRNPEESFLPARLSDVERVKQEIAERPPAGSLVPSVPLTAEISGGDALVPRATFDVMLSGKFPLIRTAEGQSWKIKPVVIQTLSNLLTKRGIADVDRWEDLIAACGRGATLYVMDSYGERYRVLDVIADIGGETGELIVQHLGRRSRGGKTMRIDIWDAYGKMLPFVVYKER